METPAGPIAKALDYARLTIAASATFRTWVGASGASAATQAYNKVYPRRLPPPASGLAYTDAEVLAMRPFAVIATAQDNGFRQQRSNVTDGYIEGGALLVNFEETVSEALKNFPDEAMGRLENTLGQIMADLWGIAGKAGFLDIRDIALIGVRAREEIEEHPDLDADNYVMAVVQILWGHA